MSTTPQTTADRFAGLARARERMEALQGGAELPPPVEQASTARKTFNSKRQEPAAAPAPVARGEVVSTSYDPSSAPAPSKQFTPNLRPEVDRSTNLEVLKLAQQRLGRDTSRQGDAHAPSAAPSGPAKSVSKSVLEDVQREAKFNKLVKLVDLISGYYKADPVEMEKEKDYLKSLSGQVLDSMTVAYETAASHVSIMTNDAHAKRVAIDSNKALRTFYNKNGTTEEQIDAEREAAQPKVKPKKPRA